MFPGLLLPAAIVDWSSLTSAVIGGAVSLAGAWLLNRGTRELETHELREAMNASFEVDFDSRLHRTKEGRDGARSGLLEISFNIKNLSRDAWAVPAVFVSARAPSLDCGRQGFCHGTQAEFDGDKLTDVSRQLSRPWNIAYEEGSLYELGPGEKEEFVSWVSVDEQLAREAPCIVIRAQAFVASHDLIGVKDCKDGEWLPQPFRMEWMTLMQDIERSCHPTLPFFRMPSGTQEFTLKSDNEEVKITAGKWVVLKPGTQRHVSGEVLSRDSIDPRTVTLHKVLESLWTLERHHVVRLAELLEPPPAPRRAPEPAPQRAGARPVFQAFRSLAR